MTEKEAKTKWCPMIRKYGIIEREGKWIKECIASECMMWRWETEIHIDRSGAHPAQQFVTSTDRGYCGLGGTP